MCSKHHGNFWLKNGILSNFSYFWQIFAYPGFSHLGPERGGGDFEIPCIIKYPDSINSSKLVRYLFFHIPISIFSRA